MNTLEALKIKIFLVISLAFFFIIPTCQYPGAPSVPPVYGETNVRYLGHAGWAIKTPSYFLIFDYWPEGISHKKPEEITLEKGYINPAEIRDQKVMVFISHAHEDHFDPVIFEWRKTIPDIIYVFGWQAEQREKCVYLTQEQQTQKIGDVEVTAIHHSFDNIPEAAFLVKVDGLVLYHSGDHAYSAEKLNPHFKSNIDYLAGVVKRIDAAFISIFCRRDGSWVNNGDIYFVKKLKPKMLFPMHGGGMEKEYKEFADAAKKVGLKTEVIHASRPGESFVLKTGKD